LCVTVVPTVGAVPVLTATAVGGTSSAGSAAATGSLTAATGAAGVSQSGMGRLSSWRIIAAITSVDRPKSCK
jgi:hypothetical protein